MIGDPVLVQSSRFDFAFGFVPGVVGRHFGSISSRRTLCRLRRPYTVLFGGQAFALNVFAYCSPDERASQLKSGGIQLSAA